MFYINEEIASAIGYLDKSFIKTAAYFPLEKDPQKSSERFPRGPEGVGVGFIAYLLASRGKHFDMQFVTVCSYLVTKHLPLITLYSLSCLDVRGEQEQLLLPKEIKEL